MIESKESGREQKPTKYIAFGVCFGLLSGSAAGVIAGVSTGSIALTLPLLSAIGLVAGIVIVLFWAKKKIT